MYQAPSTARRTPRKSGQTRPRSGLCDTYYDVSSARPDTASETQISRAISRGAIPEVKFPQSVLAAATRRRGYFGPPFHQPPEQARSGILVPVQGPMGLRPRVLAV